MKMQVTPGTDNWQNLFDSWAEEDPNLASTGGLSSPADLADLALQIGDALDLDGTQRVLDVGCASGTLTSLWAPRAGSVVGVDLSEPLLDVARQRFADSNISFVHSESAKLPFEDESFDSIACFSVLLCLPDHDYVQKTLNEILRVARPDCRIFLGSLPDIACKEIFFDHCDSLAPWYQRAIPRRLRWHAKRLLRPGSRPGETEILWFDPVSLADKLREFGFEVQVEPDPEFSNYAAYRKCMLLTRGTASLDRMVAIKGIPEVIA